MEQEKGIDALVKVLARDKPVVIQTHNFPDHDAVAAAFGLALLLRYRGVPAILCYGGEMQSVSLVDAVRLLEIPIHACADVDLSVTSQIILVDGSSGSTNVTNLPGEICAIIDHHTPPADPEGIYHDIRETYGSCSTIITEYFGNAGIEITGNLATALLMGIMMDTSFLTRGVSSFDLEAYHDLFFLGDWEQASYLLKNSMSVQDLPVFKEAIETCRIEDDNCYAFVRNSCSSELIAILADFFLHLREIRFVVVVDCGEDEFRLSVRSEDRNRPADRIVKQALKGLGSGGGHVYMGGGTIALDRFPGEEVLLERFRQAMDNGRI